MKIFVRRSIVVLVLGQVLFLPIIDCTDGHKNVTAHHRPHILPSCIDGVQEISFVLFTRQILFGKIIEENRTDIPIIANAKFRFFIHGFGSQANTSLLFMLARTWLIRENVNIFSVGWKQGACTDGLRMANLLSYPYAVDNLKAVGSKLTLFIEMLMDEYHLDLSNTILVGHSLGAHVCGFAGHAASTKFKQKYGHIIALDPAKPGFEHVIDNERLSKKDANFVQAFHTSKILGISKPIGHIDFYFNNDLVQPGCAKPQVLLQADTCSHSRAIEYMTYSLDPTCIFKGIPGIPKSNRIYDFDCNAQNCCEAGLNAVYCRQQGPFFVKTSARAPYCQNLTGR